MSDLAHLAQQAVAAIAPLLPIAATTVATRAAEGFLHEPGAKLFEWLTAQVKGKPAATALERAVAEPQNMRRLEALRLEIEEMGEKDDGFRQQLEELLKAGSRFTGSANTNQTASPSGDNSKIGQASGANIKIDIG